jgi:DoxX-like family
MNMQTLHTLFLLLDAAIKLAPWRIVTETLDRIGYDVRESVARSFGVVAMCGFGLCAFPLVSMLTSLLAAIFASVVGKILLTDCLGGAMASHARIGSPPISPMQFGCYLGAMLWGGMWLRSKTRRA